MEYVSFWQDSPVPQSLFTSMTARHDNRPDPMHHDRKTIGVLGTSNSILKNGWMSVYPAIEHPNRVVNYSAGANSSAYGVYALDHHDLLNVVDLLVIDFAVNDQNFHDSGNLELPRAEAYFYDLAHRIHHSQVPAINLLFFNRRHLESESFPIRDIQLDICDHFNIPVIDVHSLVRGLKHRPPATLFQDAAHLSPACSRPLALIVRDALRDLPPDRPNTERRSANHYRFQGIPLCKANPELARVTRATELASAECVTVPQKGINLHLGHGFIDGVVFRSSFRNGHLHLQSGRNGLNTNLAIKYVAGFYLRSLRPNLPVDGRVVLHPFRKPESPNSLPDQHQVPPVSTDLPSCDLLGLLMVKEPSTGVEYQKGGHFPDKVRQETYAFLAGCLQQAVGGSVDAMGELLDTLDRPGLLFLVATIATDRGLAIRAMNKAILLSPGNPLFHLRLGMLLQDADDPEGAAKAFSETLALKPDLHEPHARLSLLHEQAGDMVQALEHVRSALRIKPDSPRLNERMGDLLAATGDAPAAEQALLKAIQLNPDARPPHRLLLMLYRQSGRNEQARNIARAIKVLDMRKSLTFQAADACNSVKRKLKKLARRS